MNFRLCPYQRTPLVPSGNLCLVGDNGADPLLPCPFPAINYQLSIDTLNQPRLTWTVPRVSVDVTLHELAFVVAVQLRGYDGESTTASQSGTTVTLSGGSFRFTDTATDVGREIQWGPFSPNTSEVATVVSVISPTQATVQENQTVADGPFVYTCPATVFTLLALLPGESDYTIVGESTGGPGLFPYSICDLNNGRMGPMWFYPNSEFATGGVPAFVMAEISGQPTIFSDTFELINTV